MEKIIIIMLIITLGIFIYMYFTLRSQIKDITAQLDFIEKNRSNALITIWVKAGGSVHYSCFFRSEEHTSELQSH